MADFSNFYFYSHSEIFSIDDKNNKAHMAVLKELENIDDECDSHHIAFVKISNLDEAKEYGLDNLPALVYFENRIPSIYEGKVKCSQYRFFLSSNFNSFQ